jgi:hypothetical protein
LNGAKLSDYIELKNVLIEMGVYFQIQVLGPLSLSLNISRILTSFFPDRR